MSKAEKKRCAWVGKDALLMEDHDQAWGVPEYDGRALWELLSIEGFQAGLSWSIVLRKRDALRASFHGFDPARVARMTEAEVDRLVDDPRIIRSRAKINATIAGARIYEQMKGDGEDFSAWLWALAGGKPRQGDGTTHYPSTEVSEAMAKALKKRGFKFCGPVIVYAFMQASGMVNDHAEGCFRRAEVARMGKKKRA
jgi:DNA-3-methyladenine glycosylase I